jgi:hypothetical protein
MLVIEESKHLLPRYLSGHRPIYLSMGGYVYVGDTHIGSGLSFVKGKYALPWA